MVNMIFRIKINILKNKGLIAIVSLVISLLIPSILMPSNTEAVKKNEDLRVFPKTNLQAIPVLLTTIAPTTPTPQNLKIQVGIDYAGQKSADTYEASMIPESLAWDAVVSAVGLSNLQYTDYGGNMGIFITGFNGINAGSSQYFEFRVNGASSTLGVSSYKCNAGDKLDFVLTSF
jgi:hypothetical protein